MGKEGPPKGKPEKDSDKEHARIVKTPSEGRGRERRAERRLEDEKTKAELPREKLLKIYTLEGLLVYLDENPVIGSDGSEFAGDRVDEIVGRARKDPNALKEITRSAELRKRIEEFLEQEQKCLEINITYSQGLGGLIEAIKNSPEGILGERGGTYTWYPKTGITNTLSEIKSEIELKIKRGDAFEGLEHLFMSLTESCGLRAAARKKAKLEYDDKKQTKT